MQERLILMNKMIRVDWSVTFVSSVRLGKF